MLQTMPTTWIPARSRVASPEYDDHCAFCPGRWDIWLKGACRRETKFNRLQAERLPDPFGQPACLFLGAALDVLAPALGVLGLPHAADDGG